MALIDLLRGKGEKEGIKEASVEGGDQEEGEEEEEEEEEEEQADYSFASIYTGPRPAFVPKAQTLTASRDVGKHGRYSSCRSNGISSDINGSSFKPETQQSQVAKNGDPSGRNSGASFSVNGSISDPSTAAENPRGITGNRWDSIGQTSLADSVNSECSPGSSVRHPLPLSQSSSSVAHPDCVLEQRTSPDSSISGDDSRIHATEGEEEAEQVGEGKKEEAQGDEMASCLGMQEPNTFSSMDIEAQRHGEPPSSGHDDAVSTPSSGRPSSLFRTSTDNESSSPDLKTPSSATPNDLKHNHHHIPKKGECHECLNASWMREKETCLVCNAKICIGCVLKVMGSMPEGRKCMKCVGYPIDESRRSKLGKPSRLLNRLLNPLEVHQIMKVERECISNQIRPNQIYVNGRQLSTKELAELLACGTTASSKLRPGRYWYDNQCGYWGKEGEKPNHIIKSGLTIGGALQEDASAGNTQVFINNREITKAELKVLTLLNVQCPPTTRLWVDPNGAYKGEGQNNSLGNIWNTPTSKFLYPLFSLPTPNSQSVGPRDPSSDGTIFLAQEKSYKILLLGFPGSGTSAIFKQVKLLYNDFTPAEVHNLKLMIQRDIYKYIIILLEARERFEDEENMKRSAGMDDMLDGKNGFSINEKLKAKADFFLDIMVKGEFDMYFPAATREYAPRVEEIWKDPAIQATYQRRSELHVLPEAAGYFLDKVVEMSSPDYELSENDILYAEGTRDGLGFVEVEFSLEGRSFLSSRPLDNKEHSLVEKTRYHLIRINVNGMLDGVQKWLDMFEDINAVIFCVGLDAYNQMLSTTATTTTSSSSSSTATADELSQPKNKMMVTRELFESILSYPCFQGKPILLFLNKYDAFEQKALEAPITTCEWFSTFNPVPSARSSADHVAQPAYAYIAHKFKQLYTAATGEKLFTFKMNAHQKSMVEDALWYVKSVIDWEEERKGAQALDMVEESTCTTTTELH